MKRGLDEAATCFSRFSEGLENGKRHGGRQRGVVVYRDTLRSSHHAFPPRRSRRCHSRRTLSSRASWRGLFIGGGRVVEAGDERRNWFCHKEIVNIIAQAGLDMRLRKMVTGFRATSQPDIELGQSSVCEGISLVSNQISNNSKRVRLFAIEGAWLLTISFSRLQHICVQSVDGNTNMGHDR